MSLLSLCPKERWRRARANEMCSSHTLSLYTTIKIARIKFKGNMLCHATNANDLSLSRLSLCIFKHGDILVRVLLVLFLLLMLMVVCQYIGGCYNYVHFLFEKKNRNFFHLCVCASVCFCWFKLHNIVKCYWMSNARTTLAKCAVCASVSMPREYFTHRFKEEYQIVFRERTCIGDIRKLKRAAATITAAAARYGMLTATFTL